MLLSNLCSLCEWLNSSQCLQCDDAIFITTQCALARFSILLIIWIELTSNFKTSFRLYILLTECKCYYDAKSLRSQSNCEMSSFAILSDADLILKSYERNFFKKISSKLVAFDIMLTTTNFKTLKILWMSFTRLIQRQQNLLCEMTK